MKGNMIDVALKDASLDDLAKEITRRIRSMEYLQLKELREGLDGPAVYAIREACDELTALCDDIREEMR